MSEHPTGEHTDGESSGANSSQSEEPLWTTFYHDSGYRTSEHDKEPDPPNWIEKGTFIVLLLTLAAAGAAAFEADRLARDTEIALTDARTVANGNAVETGQLIAATQDFAAAMKRQADNTGNLVTQAQNSAGYARTSAIAAQGQLQEMHGEQRPIIAILSIKPIDGLRFSNAGASILLQFSLKNEGRSIAQFVQPKTLFYARTTDDAAQRQKATCYRPHDTFPANSGVAVYPGEQSGPIIGVKMSVHDFALWRASPIDHATAIPTVVGCVDYTFGKIHHHAGYILEIDSAQGQPQNGAVVFSAFDTTKGDVSADKIVFGVNPNQPSLND